MKEIFKNIERYWKYYDPHLNQVNCREKVHVVCRTYKNKKEKIKCNEHKNFVVVNFFSFLS